MGTHRRSGWYLEVVGHAIDRELLAGPVRVACLIAAIVAATTSALAQEPDRWVDERTAMVREQIQARGIESEPVLGAMLSVPRHEFVPPEYRRFAYSDRPLPIGLGQTISQPYIVALMTELMDLDPDDRVLEVGTGSGFQAAVASALADSVFTIEIFESLSRAATERLRRLGFNRIETLLGDGYYGWAEKAPFDAIVVTAAAGHIPPPLVRQLTPGGRMIVPVGGVFQVQHLVLVEKAEDGMVTTRNVLPVRFVPLLGHEDSR